MRVSRSGLLCVAAAGLLAGCHLIDRSDVRPPRPPVVQPPIPDAEARTPLVTIAYATANPDYRTALGEAVKAVETRRPGSLYDVVAVIGGSGDAQAGRLRAADVMTAIEANGVVAARVQLGLAVEPGRTVQQVRVYLR